MIEFTEGTRVRVNSEGVAPRTGTVVSTVSAIDSHVRVKLDGPVTVFAHRSTVEAI